MQIPFADPLLIFATVMALIVLSPIVAQYLRIPPIVGLILAGLLVGPHGLGWIGRDPTIELLGQVGLLYIMFVCGLEIDLHRARLQRAHSLVFGLLTFCIPLAIGTGLGIFALRMDVTTAVLMASMFASHTLLTVPIVGRLGLIKSRSVTTAIGGTIITDTLALLVLVAVAAVHAGDASASFWVVLALRIAACMLGVVVLAPIVGRWFLRHLSADENIEFASMLAIAFAASYLAHVAGLEPIIGAFLAGLTLNQLIPEKSGLMTRIRFTGNALFIPFFLLSVGMLVDLALLWGQAGVWKVAAGMVAVALLSKWLAAVVSGNLLRYSKQESALIFGLSVNQAAATLAAAMVGHRIGLFDDGIITGTVIMIGVTCLAGPVITEKAGRMLALQSRRGLEDAPAIPQRILLPIQGKDRAREMLDLAFFLRGDASQEPLYPVHVVLEGPRADADIAHGEAVIAHTVIRSLSANVPVNPLTVVDVSIPSGILRAGRENRISIIALFWDGRHGYRARAFGSIIDRVVSGSRQMVLVNRVVYSVSAAQRVLVLCPPFISQQPGFAEALVAIKTIVKQGGARMVLMTTADTLAVLDGFARKTRPAVPMECKPYSDWKSILELAAGEIQPNDWIITVEARIGQLAWQPSSERLPRQMAHRFPGHNLTFVYPPEESGAPPVARDVSKQGRMKELLKPECCLLGADSAAMRDLLERLLISPLGGDPLRADAVIRSLCAIAARDPVELEPGIVLLHDHSDCVKGPEIYLATAAVPFRISGAGAPCQVVMVLLDPVGQGPAEHLAALSRVAELMTIPGFVEHVRQAWSYEDLNRRLAEHGARPPLPASPPGPLPEGRSA